MKVKVASQLYKQTLSTAQIPVINTDISLDVTRSKNMLIYSFMNWSSKVMVNWEYVFIQYFKHEFYLSVVLMATEIV
jgi:hypothetical protein